MARVAPERQVPACLPQILMGGYLGGNRMTRRKFTDSYFKKLVFELVADEYTFIEPYKGITKKLAVRHEKCGHRYETTPYHFLDRGQRCPNCNYMRKRTPEEFEKEFHEALGDDYEILTPYKGAREKIKVRHKICGCEYLQTASEAKQGKGCRKCSIEKFIGNRLKSEKRFIQDFERVSNSEYQLLSKYVNDGEYINVKHKDCGLEYSVVAGAFLNGRRCPKCGIINRANKQRRTHEQFEKLVLELGINEYAVLENYKNSQIPIKLKHLSCGHIYSVRPNDFLRGKRCPKCNQSHGETKIYQLLSNYNIKFTTQYRFSNCKAKRSLPFDFAILDANETVVAVIEYQGIQHYQANDFFGGEVAFKKRREHDAIKENYCKANNIRFVEIPYSMTDKEIEKAIFELTMPIMSQACRETAGRCND
ncbi:hypothetical protein RV01_GL001256 [Enterococcus dispar]|nr:hypothetical protein RV01_GL001256 [Enterococcus dispar]